MNRFQAHREPFTKGEKVLFAFLPLGILAFVVSGLWLRRGEQAPQIVLPTPAALPNPNGFDIYVAAAGAITPATPSVDPIDDRTPLLTTNPKLAAQNYSLTRRTAWLRANTAGFALVKQGLKTPSRFNPNTGFGSFGKLRQLARSKTIEANTLVLQRRWNEATRSSLDTVQMGFDVARGGPLMARLMGTGLTAIGRDPMFTNQFVPEKLTTPQAKTAARRLEAILATRPNWKDALVEAKWTTLADFMVHVQRGNWRTVTQGNPEIAWKERFSSQFLSAGEVARRISESYDRSIENVQKPYNVAILPAAPLDPISSMFVSDSDFRFNEGREIVPLNTLLLRFALRAYQLENGEFPTALSQLAPRYLKKIPTDYFASGAPFRYRRNGKNYDLWSVGPDKVDNGGVPIKNRGGKSGVNEWGRFPSIMPESTGDYVAAKNR